MVYTILMPGTKTNILKLSADTGLSFNTRCIQFKNADTMYIAQNNET